MKRIAAFLLILLAAMCLCSCGSEQQDESEQESGVIKLSFKAASGYDYLKSIEGQTVTINGYMATSSPVDGSYIYLMNMPYQSCPFCKPNTSELSNTMEVYPKSGKTFEYTTQAIAVTGTLKVAEEGELFSDPYGYEFSFEIVDASYKILSSDDLSEEMALWQKISSSGVITDVSNMYEYLNFVCTWNTYYCNSTTLADGTVQPGYYLYDTDAIYFLKTEGAQFNYGYQDGYFDDLIASVRAVDKDGFNDLIQNIEKCEALAEKAINELDSGNYTSEYIYVEMFEAEDWVFTLTNGEELANELDSLYLEFSTWLASWEV